MQTYDPTKVSLTVAGNTIIGFAAGTFIKAMRNEDAFSLHIGADGSGARVRNANRSGRFEITLRASSPSNSTLAALAVLDELTGAGVGAAQVEDGSGTALAHAQNAWVVKHADLERAKEDGDVTWILETDRLDIYQGGTEVV